MTKLKTATVTWISWDNYGTYLQAYALQQVLRNLGCDNKIICDAHYAHPTQSLKQRLRFFWGLLKRPQKGKTRYLFELFKRRFLRIDRCRDCKKLNTKYDLFICGSDQIWSPYLKHEPYYYLRYFTKRKIAYAPSTGTCRFTATYIKKILPDLQDFVALSLREEHAAYTLSAQTGLNIVPVTDPTLLLTAAEWRKLIPASSPKGQYILCYFLTPNSWYMNWVKEYAVKHNYRIRIFNTHAQYDLFGETIAAGPREFISFIDSAKVVFTDSFHATIFCILLHKKFVTFKRFEDYAENDQNERLYNLFRKLAMENYFIGKDSLSIIDIPPPNYEKIEKMLEKWREDSLGYLKKAIYTK